MEGAIGGNDPRIFAELPTAAKIKSVAMQVGHFAARFFNNNHTRGLIPNPFAIIWLIG